MRNLLVFFSILLFVSCGTEEHATTTPEAGEAVPAFQNPLLTGFYPDPALCKANGQFHLTTSTFAYFPGLPIFTSNDLVSWKQIGNAMNRPSQLQLKGLGISWRNLAPSISFHDETYHVICTLADAGGNFIVTATDPAGPWSVPYFLPEVDGIDPSIVFEGEETYIVYTSIPPANKSLYGGHRTIRIAEGVPGKHLSIQEAGGFVGVTVGMYATSSGETSDNTASFECFRYAGDAEILRT